MDIKSFLTKNWKHFAILAVFVIVTVAYFSPEFDGFGLKQHDVEQHKGMSNETQHFREATGEEPFWTNSMFGGMPTVQISTLYNGNVFQKITIWFLGSIGVPAGIFLLHLIGFYILGLCLRVKPLIALFGALAFALSTYEILILQAGHNSKAIAVAFMAPVVGAFIMSYRNSWKWGVILSALFMTFELSSNHLQVTYYLGMLLFAIGLYELAKALKTKEHKQFSITSVALAGAYVLALLINYGNITATNDYAKHTIRGANDLTINPDGSEAKNTGGLDIDYITNWSYGIGESFTFLSPYVKGSHSNILANMPFREKLEISGRSSAQVKSALSASYLKADGRGGVQARPFLLYWGEQPITSGPFYLGIAVLFLAMLSLVFLKDKIKWVFFVITVLALMLSWGKNFMWLTEFFVDNIPGYNKFRTVTIINVLIELCIPLMGVLFLQKIYQNREEFKAKKKLYIISSTSFLFVMLGITVIGIGDNFTNPTEVNSMRDIESYARTDIYTTNPQELSEYGIDVNNQSQMQSVIESQVNQYEESYKELKSFRSELFTSSMLRSVGFLILSIIIIALFFFTDISSISIVGGLVVIVLIDLVPVNRMYLGSDKDASDNYVHWVPKAEIAYPISSQETDLIILDTEINQNPTLAIAINEGKIRGEKKAAELEYSGKDKRRVIDSYIFSALNMNTNYRVFDMNGGWGSSRASYFHKSLGGYHGAKLRNIQNLFEFQIAKSNSAVLNMLNVKYFIQGGAVNPNLGALGNAWLVKDIRSFETPDDEIRALGGKYQLSNFGKGKMIINGKTEQSSVVYGSEQMLYISLLGDTLEIPLSNGLAIGLKVLFVADIDGRTNLVPEQTIRLDTANSFTSMVSIEKIEEFIPSKEVIMLSSESKKLSKQNYTGIGTIKMKSYAPNKIVYDAEIDDKQLAVFSEIYYPEGWGAKVDGEDVEILKVNYLLRGLELDGGNHVIEFSFDIPKIRTSNTIAVLGTVFLVLCFGVGFWKIPLYDTDEKELPTKT